MKETMKNLAAAFIGESQARNRYTMYSKVAKKEGYEQIAAIFLETAEQEREHAAQLFKMIKELKAGAEGDWSEIKVEAGVPTIYESTAENLKAAIAGEHHETTSMYPEFSETAKAEGLAQVASKLTFIGKAEAHHEERYSKLLTVLEDGSIFKKSTDVWWFCRECGYAHFGQQPPEECPSCGHAKGFYQLMSENY